MFASIRVRLTLSHLLVIVLAMGVSGFLLLSFLERYFLQAMENSLLAQARVIAQALIPNAVAAGPDIETQAPAYNTVQQQRVGSLALQTQNVAPSSPGNLPLDLSSLNNASLELSTMLDTHIRLLDAQGVVQADSQNTGQGANLRADPLAAQALAGRYASRTDGSILDFWSNPPATTPADNEAVYSSRSSAKLVNLRQEAAMHLALPVLVEGKVVGVVYLSQPLNDVTAVLRDMRLRWLLATGIALGLSALVGLLLSRAIATPLRRLTAAAGAVAEGHLDQQVPVTSRDELGRLSRAFNDMTTRLKAARQMQIDMVANVSHELRTPLTSIKGYIETLRDGAVDDPEVRDTFLETTENETNRLIRLVNDLMLLSRVDAETLNLQRRPTDLAQLAQDTVERLSFQAEARQVRLEVDLKSAPPPVEVDPDRLAQVLVNLLDNAIKYSRPGGRVTLSVGSEPDGSTLIQVQDEGMGIAPADLARVGQRFYRADRARSRAEGGSGLGLAIARSLVEAHGGQLWMESEEGQGTVVSFTIPPA